LERNKKQMRHHPTQETNDENTLSLMTRARLRMEARLSAGDAKYGDTLLDGSPKTYVEEEKEESPTRERERG
jgi:hypothetical protein